MAHPVVEIFDRDEEYVWLFRFRLGGSNERSQESPKNQEPGRRQSFHGRFIDFVAS
jgi:hypothetical protein